MEQGQDRTVVLAVVVMLGLFGLVGLVGIIWLIHGGIDAASVAVVSTLTGTAIGALGTLLATTRSNPPQNVQAAADGAYKQALDDVSALVPAA